jgi:hypothetical protein
MKRLVICCDGAWNRRKQRFPASVLELSEAAL